MNRDFVIVHYSDLETEPFTQSETDHRKLTGPLGATEMRVSAVELDPGEALESHSHERQEEVANV